MFVKYAKKSFLNMKMAFGKTGKYILPTHEPELQPSRSTPVNAATTEFLSEGNEGKNIFKKFSTRSKRKSKIETTYTFGQVWACPFLRLTDKNTTSIQKCIHLHVTYIFTCSDFCLSP